MLEGTFTSPPWKADGRLEFDFQNIEVTTGPPNAGHYALSGRIVATTTTPDMFELLLHYFNADLLRLEAQR